MELGNLAQQPADDGYFTVKIAGDSVRVPKPANVKDTLRQELSHRGISSFTIFLNGDEIRSSDDLPETFEDCTTVEVQRYTKSGS